MADGGQELITVGEKQERVREMVNDHVIYCVSGLVSKLVETDNWEEFEDILRQEVKQYRGSYGCEVCGECWDGDWKDTYEGAERPALCPECYHPSEATEDVEEGADEDEYIEAYEHWIVSNWLADRLEARGEMVSKDVYGLTVWGRAATGQAIFLDGVMADIYDDLHPLEEYVVEAEVKGFDGQQVVVVVEATSYEEAERIGGRVVTERLKKGEVFQAINLMNVGRGAMTFSVVDHKAGAIVHKDPQGWCRHCGKEFNRDEVGNAHFCAACLSLEAEHRREVEEDKEPEETSG